MTQAGDGDCGNRKTGVYLRRATVFSTSPWRVPCSLYRVPATVWKGHLTFGLVSIPIRLYRAARKKRIQLHYLQRDSRSIGEAEEPIQELDETQHPGLGVNS